MYTFGRGLWHLNIYVWQGIEAFKHLCLAGDHGMSFKISIALGSGADQGLSKNGIFDKTNLIVKNKTVI